MEQAVEDDQIRWSPETVRVHEWRFDWLKRAGYSDGAAAVLAQRTDIDWHEASNLLKHCPEKTALKILL